MASVIEPTAQTQETPQGTAYGRPAQQPDAALTQVGLLTAAPGSAFAQQPSLDGKTFLALSKALTGHPDLDPTTASRLVDAFGRTDAGFAARATALAQRVRPGQTPAQLLADADGAGLHDTALAIVAAWYTGTVGHGQKAVMVAYADALMYDTVHDGMSAPTYCSNGPLWWTAEPPPWWTSTTTVAARRTLTEEQRSRLLRYRIA